MYAFKYFSIYILTMKCFDTDYEISIKKNLLHKKKFGKTTLYKKIDSITLWQHYCYYQHLLVSLSLSYDDQKAFAQGGIVPPEPLAPQGLINSGAKPSTDVFNIPSGYKMEPILWNLTLPSTVTFDDNGSMYIAESGYSYGGFHPVPRILKNGFKW